ncbi:MAG: polyprenyl synthetase family protein [Erysipelotrichaceae bacterium]
MKTFETYLASCLNDVETSSVKDAMMYSLMAEGKRIRPRLLFATLMAYDIDPVVGYASAAAIEMIHTYSLIHDDLPAMDNDDMRRGKPTCHVKFGEACAILAGDALLTQSFVQGANASEDPLISNKIVKALATFSGADGMVLGQTRDLEAENTSIDSVEMLQSIHLYKTGKLITLPLICAAYLAKRDQDIDTWISIGERIGLSFQIQDDVLDVTSSSDVLGKNVKSDLENEKATYVKFWGIEKCIQEENRLYEEAKELIHTLPIDREVLDSLLLELSTRIK